MNWSEPSIRAEQALKRANQAAEDKDWKRAMETIDDIESYLAVMWDALHTKWCMDEEERKARASISTEGS